MNMRPKMKSDRPIGKKRRQSRIRELITAQTISTHGQLLDALGRDGIRITQATLSRDLREMGVGKMPEGLGRFAYRVTPIEPAASERDLKNKFATVVKDIRGTGNLIIIRTMPGEAQAVARLVDTARIHDILGTVAGDDTILVIVDGAINARRVHSAFLKLMGKA